jgi:predicted Rossmann-fold nucleotide-binding protein
VLNGGYNGSMAAVSRGAREAGGHVIGVTCAIFDPLLPNPWLTEEVKAPTLLARLALIMDRADGFVAARGGIGTLSEVTLAWSLLQTRSLNGKPLVLLGDDWQAIVDTFRNHSDLSASIIALARIVLTPHDVLVALAAPPIPPGPPPPG